MSDRDISVKQLIILKILLLSGVLIIAYGIVRLIVKNSKKEQKRIQMTGSSGFHSFIEFLLEQEKEGNIILGRRKDKVFVGFHNEQMNGFLSEWFEVLRLWNQKGSEDDMYDIWVNYKKKQLRRKKK